MKFDEWSIELLDSISIGICIVDRDYKVLYWSDFMQFNTGITQEDILGKGIHEFFPEFGRDIYRENIDLIFSGWPPLFFSSRLNRLFHKASETDDKYLLYQDVTITSLSRKTGEGYDALITVNDVTELNRKLEERNKLYRTAQEEIRKRLQTEARLRDSEAKLKELNVMKNKLLSIIAHDLRNPLSSTINGLDLLMKSSEDIVAEERQEMLGLLMDGSREALNLLEDLLAWARLNSKGVVIDKTAFRINEIISEELRRISPVARKKGISLSLENFKDSTVFADRNMIQAVLRNLISNAIKFTGSGGSVILSSEVFANSITICVKDTGVGMDHHVIEKLFKAEELSSSRGTANEKGTGFGLIFTKELLEKNEGSIHVESSKGIGSNFIITLPLTDTMV